MGRPLAGEGFLETRLTDYLEDWFRELGVACRRTADLARAATTCWRGTRRPRRGGRSSSTSIRTPCPTDGMTIPPFEPTIAGGRLSGRGSCDVKGSMAAMLTAFARLVRERPAGSASVLLACTVDEEFTHTGSSRLAEIDHGAELAIVAEPTLLEPGPLPQGCPAVEDPDPRARLPQLDAPSGVNAIYRMGHVLEALETYAGDALAIHAPSDPRAAEPVRRSNRGGPERQRRPRLVRDRGRPPPDPGRGRRRGAWTSSEQSCSRTAAGP